jgi:citrate synthase
MRNIFGLFYDTSLLDSKTGITYRDYSIPEISEYIQKADKGHEPLPEGVFWLLCTGEFPTHHEFEDIQNEWRHRGHLDNDVIKFI